MPRDKREFLDPMSVVMYPYERFPTMHPIAKAEPTHDTSSTFMAPVSNGLSSDSSNGSANEIQLIPQPNPINKILALYNKNTSFNLKHAQNYCHFEKKLHDIDARYCIIGRLFSMFDRRSRPGELYTCGASS